MNDHHKIEDRHRRRLRRLTTATALVASLALASCSLGGGTEQAGSEGAGGAGDASSGTGSEKTVVLATHDSWNVPRSVLQEFTEETGYRVKVEPVGDVGQLTNRLVLTKGSPIADAVYGIDNTFASRAVDEGVLADYTPEQAPFYAEDFAVGDEAADAALTPIDFGDVCVNIDDAWFAQHDVPPPASLDDLADPAYRGLFVTPGAASSSPGLAFLLATIAEYGEDGWQDYWKKLMANGAKITAGWSDAYEVDFTAGGGKGDRPIVLSYASSPPFTIPEGGDEPTTSALLDTCFRQVEYAGVLQGAANTKGAEALVDFMTQKSFQEALPDSMYVFPVDLEATLPEDVGAVRRRRAEPLRGRARDDRAEPRHLAARVERRHHPMTATRAWAGPRGQAAARRRARRGGGAAAARVRGVLRAAGRGHARPRLRPRRRLDLGGVRRCWPARGCTGCCGSRCGPRPWRPPSTVLLGLPVAFVLYRLRFPGRGLLRAFVPMPFVLPTVVVGVAFRSLLARRARSGPSAWTARRPRSSPRWCSSTSPSSCAPSGRCGRASTSARAGRRCARGLAVAGAPHGHAAGADAGDHLGGQHRLPLLRHGVRGGAHPRRAALRHGRDRDLPADHPAPRPAGGRRAVDAAARRRLRLLYVAQRARARREHALDRVAPRDVSRRPRGRRRRRSSWSPALVLALRGRAARARSCVRSLQVDGPWSLDHYRCCCAPGGTAPCWCRRPRRWRTPGGSRSTRRCSRSSLGLLVSLVVSRRAAPRAGRRGPGPARRRLHAASRRLGGDPRLRVPDDPRPAAARPAQLAGAGADRAGDGRAAARRPHPGAGPPLDRPPAATGRGVAGRPAVAGAADRRPAGGLASAARRDRVRLRGVARGVRGDQLPGPSGPADAAGA